MFDPGLLVAVSVPVVVFDGDRVAFANAAHDELIGRREDDIVGRAAVELLGDGGAAALATARARLAAGAGEQVCAVDWRSAAGDRVRVVYAARLASSALLIMTAAPTSSAITAHATSDSRHAIYEGIVSLADDAIIAVDTEQRIVLFNEGAERIFGWSVREVIGRSLDVLLAPRFRARHRVGVAQFMREPASARRMAEARADVAGLRKSGEEFPAEAGISRIRVGGTTLLAVVLRDIGERKRRENEQRFLAHAGATLASTLDYQETLATVARLAVPLLADCCIVDLLQDDVVRRHKVVHVDPDRARLAAELERVEVREVGTDLHWQTLAERRSVLLPTVPPDYLERNAQDPEHLRLWRELAPVSLISVPMVSRSRVLGALSFVSVRPNHRYGRPELNLAEELARRAALALDNSRLYALSQQAIRARDEILGVVAHDLRNPISVIMMAAEASLRAPGDPPRRPTAGLDAITRAAAHANRLIQDLLDVARIEAGRTLALERTSCRPADLLGDAYAMMRPTAEAASLSLSRDSGDELPAIEADRERILQVFSNLIGNAVKFTPDGGRVHLSASLLADGVCFAVTDSGPGISPEQLPHIFDRYWQAWSSARRGVGLGLAIVKGIVEAHGGRVWAESRLGAGSTFYFTIPRDPPGPARASSEPPQT